MSRIYAIQAAAIATLIEFNAVLSLEALYSADAFR